MPCCSLIYDKRYHSSPSWELIFYILRKVGTFSVDKMEWINCLIWTFSQYLCPTAFHTLQEWFYPYKKNGNTASIQAYTLLMLFEPLSRVRRLMQLFLFYGYWKTISRQCHPSLRSFRRGWGEETDDISDYSSAVFCLRFTSYKIKTRLIITSVKMIRFLSM